MWRAFVEPLVLFLAPFVLYALYLLALRRNPAATAHWQGGPSLWLTIAGLVVAVAGMLVFGLTARRQLGAYTPAHIENGRVVPGHFQ
ncbi:MAG: hypothetical protein KGM42_11680 [Hyphomicrobiales bacterium]|nr:hypothetical protein [Hyphomicrobiales bacterium]